MLDNKTLNRWLEIRATISKPASELYLYGSDRRESAPEVAAFLFQAAETLYEVDQLLSKAILRASAEENND